MTVSLAPAPTRSLSRAEAVELAQKCAQVLVEQFGARRVIPFGSVTGASPWHSRSDIDLAVEGLDSKVFFKAWAALDECVPPGAFVEIDLIDLNETPPELRALILGEMIMPKDNPAALKLEIENELKNLERVVKKPGNRIPRLKAWKSAKADWRCLQSGLPDFHVFSREIASPGVGGAEGESRYK